MNGEGRDVRILVTGASGVLGQALIEELRESGFRHVVGAATADADLTDQVQAAALLLRVRPEVVYHLAGRVYGVMGNLKNKGRAYLENIRINTNVIEAARAVSVRKIVAMGSTAVYSDLAKLPMSEDDLWLGPPHSSEAPYAHAKRAMLAQLEAYHDAYGIDYAFCMSTNLFGPHDRFDENYGHVIPSLISKFCAAKESTAPVIVWGTGSPQRDFLYAKDAAYALRLIAEKHTGPINVATGHAISIKEAVEIIRDVSGFKGEVLWDHTKPDGQRLRAYNVDRLLALGFRPQHTLREAITETFNWYSEDADKARR